jgi:site-specific DNA-methyltransferase (adenine-specific)
VKLAEEFLNGRVSLHCGDCRDVLATLAENSIDSCVTDPPYHLTSIIKRFGVMGPNDKKLTTPSGPDSSGGNPFQRSAVGFMGKQWDGGDVAFRPETWAAVYRVLKPGAHLVAFGGTRTFARMAVAIEDAGFEIRDTIMWLYGSGFPKSHDVSKGIDRAAGIKRPEMGHDANWGTSKIADGKTTYGDYAGEWKITAAGDLFSSAWNGWGTALKPPMELIVLARKPLSESTVAANVLRWGTGAINVDGCRVATEARQLIESVPKNGNFSGVFREGSFSDGLTNQGRWPANVVHDGSDEVVAAFPKTNPANASYRGLQGRHDVSSPETANIKDYSDSIRGHDDNGGSAARFFYTSKADADDRLGSKHPTVKPVDLMQWLVRLVTPKNGTCLDPFSGTGTTGEAAWREGMRAVLIEAEHEYQEDIRRRMVLALSGPDERNRESIKAKNLPRDDGPLFAMLADDYDADDDFARSYDECLREIRERKANGGKGWEPP